MANLLVTAGPTREPIDQVRFLSNYSTGYMGAQLAAEALARGHRVTVIAGPCQEPMPQGAHVVSVERAEDMERELRRRAVRGHIIMMAAAVADYAARTPRGRKLPRRKGLTLALKATPDIIGRLPRRSGQIVVGFALESGAVVPRAMRKLRTKRLDCLLAQQLNGTHTPFGRNRIQAWLLDRSGSIDALGTLSKGRAARALLDKAETLWYRRDA